MGNRKRPVHVEVYLKPGEDQERLTRRFFRKCKKLDLQDLFLKNRFFKGKREKQREKRRKNEFIKRKLSE